MSGIINAFFNCLPGIILIAGIVGYQIASERAARRAFDRERDEWEQLMNAQSQRLRGGGEGE